MVNLRELSSAARFIRANGEDNGRFMLKAMMPEDLIPFKYLMDCRGCGVGNCSEGKEERSTQ